MTDHPPEECEAQRTEETAGSEAHATEEAQQSSPGDEELESPELEQVAPKPIDEDEARVAPIQVAKQPETAESVTDDGGTVEEEDDDDDEEDDEPKLKYVRLTQHLGPVYRNGDATGAFLVAGDKMVVGTLDGNIHIIQLPEFKSLRVYHAHSASVTSVSISPYPPPLPTPEDKIEQVRVASAANTLRPGSAASTAKASPAAASRRPHGPPPVPNIPSNNIFIGTASMDGNVCVQSLIDIKDVQLRNFSRPVQAVSLSPDFKNDRTYLSGGLAGQLILTQNAPPGKSTSTLVSATAQAAGWFNNMVGAQTGKDTVLHAGEGTITTIRWSLSGKYVAWLNEHGIKIMRTRNYLEGGEANEDAWKRIGHIDRPQTEEWDAMAAAWRGRVEWIDETAVETDESTAMEVSTTGASTAVEKLREQQRLSKKLIERLLVGWGGTIWIIHVHPGGVGTGKNVGERSAGRAEIVKLLRMDCIISGISLYTQNLLLVLAYCLPDKEEDEEDTRGHKKSLSSASSGSEPTGGRRRRQNNQPPELRLIDLTSQAEVDKDGLSVSRFERLNASDYHLGVLPAQNTRLMVQSKGVLDSLAGLGADMLNAAINPRGLFSSAASIRSQDSGGKSASISKVPSTASMSSMAKKQQTVHPNLVKPGAKIFIHSPYDCILATKRDLGDHLQWLLERQQYQQAWELVDEHPEIMIGEKIPDTTPSTPSGTSAPTLTADNFYDETSSQVEGLRNYYSSAEKEKRRIGELWVQQLVTAGEWTHAGQVCGRVLTSPDRWEKWVYTFASAHRLDDIAPYMPIEPLVPPIPGTVYEVVLGHYIQNDKPRFRELLERWSPELFDINAITTALENQLKYREVREDSVDDGETGRDWRIVMESLARLHEVNGRAKEALRCYIKLQDADNAMRLVKSSHLAEAVADDIPSFIGLRVPAAQIEQMSRQELEEATSEAITLLVDEAQHGLVKPEAVVEQLEKKRLSLYLYFYLKGLWKGEGIHEHGGESYARLVADSQSLVEGFADLAVRLFARFDQELLGEFLRSSVGYSFEEAVEICESYNYIPELVFLYSKTGQMKRALYLIIDRLSDVSRAIKFAKSQNDPDLWDDLLDYSMDKPRFIRALLDEVGTSIDPLTIVRRIPEGLEIPGLREGLKHMMKEHEIQASISEGVARVLRSEVNDAQRVLRSGQQKGVKFEVTIRGAAHVDVRPRDVIGEDEKETSPTGEARPPKAGKKWAPGHCALCLDPFVEWEAETLVGFACGHVYHLRHLLEHLRPGESVDEGSLGGDVDGGGGLRVGSKVMHARLLRGRLMGGRRGMGGCVVCKGRK